MANKKVEHQANVYVFDLNNCAREYGFKADDLWELSLASDVEKREIERKYLPSVSTKALPELLLELGHMVKEKLVKAKSVIEKQLNANSMPDTELLYLVAYNPKRVR